MVRPVLVSGLAVFAALCSIRCGPADPGMPFNGSSGDLKATRVVATLDAPIPKGTSVIWCASFLGAWKAMVEDWGEAPVPSEGDFPLAATLNAAADPRGWLPEGALYTATGWLDKGIGQTIASDLKKRFPSKQPPVFEGAPLDGFVAYSYLEANVPFALPYFQNSKPLNFKDSTGKTTPIKSFGIRGEDWGAYEDLRAQAHILFRTVDEDRVTKEFAVDLCGTSSPSQVIVACLDPSATLADALAKVEKESLEFAKTEHGKVLDIDDVLLVPDLYWQVSHRYKEIEGMRPASGPLKGRPLLVAQQDILFRLSRSGAELKSEAKVICSPIPSVYIADRPFLIAMKKRGAASPYFAMWVANGELLQRW